MSSLVLSLSFLMSLVGVTGTPKPQPSRAFTVVIDPGHGGANEGCEGAGGHVHEKELTLELSMKLQARLSETLPHASVYLTRTSDRALTLADRTAFANDMEADLLISVHGNASVLHNQQGFETFVLESTMSEREVAHTAMRENDQAFAVPAGRDPVMSMVRELGLSHNRVKASRLARAIQDEYQEAFPLRPDRGVRQGPFDVLMGARMPAVLTEVGFLDNEVEGPMLQQPQQQAKIVGAMSDAIVGYYTKLARTELSSSDV